VRIGLVQLRADVMAALRYWGYTADEADVVAEVLMYAQLRGSTQGIVKLVGEGIPKDRQAKTPTVARETPVSALVDGRRSAGILVMARATRLCLEKAQQHGIAVVGTFNTCTGTGAIGYYARLIAQSDLIGFACSGSPPAVCPFGTYEAIFGTNPMAVGVPTDGDPLVFDMATAAITRYGLIEALTARKSVDGDLAYDSHGLPTCNPALALEGAIRTFDRGPKGSGLALIIEILTGPLVCASFGGLGDANGNWGNTVAAVSPALMGELADFKRNVSALIARIKKANPLAGFQEILVPGEREDRLAEGRIASRELEIEERLYEELREIVAREQRVNRPGFSGGWIT